MNEEAYKIRCEINRLNRRLLEIDNEISVEESAQLCSSNVCGHDVVLEHIQKLCGERETKSIAIMAGRERGKTNRWYSTTITPECLPYFLRSVETIKNYLEQFLDIDLLRIIQHLSVRCNNVSTEEISLELDIPLNELHKLLNKLIEYSLITQVNESKEQRWSITSQGWHAYLVLGHLSFNYTYKLEIEKAIHIMPAFKELFDKEWGEYLGLSYAEVIQEFTKTGWLVKLKQIGVSESDIEKAIYEANYVLVK